MSTVPESGLAIDKTLDEPTLSLALLIIRAYAVQSPTNRRVDTLVIGPR